MANIGPAKDKHGVRESFAKVFFIREELPFRDEGILINNHMYIIHTYIYTYILYYLLTCFFIWISLVGYENWMQQTSLQSIGLDFLDLLSP